MLKDFPQFVPQDVCLSCDGCCRFKEEESVFRPKIAPSEVKEASSHLPLAEKIFSQNAVDLNGHIKTLKKDGLCQCMFFDSSHNTCTIYAYRPFECQLYPFLLTRGVKGIVVCAHHACPYIQLKRNNTLFEEYVASLKKYFEKKEVLEFIRNNPFLAGDYSQYQNELEEIFLLEL